MCALFGFLDCGKRVPMRTLQKLLQSLANASEVRGKHASGIAYNTRGELKIYKRPRPAHRMHFRLPEGTAAVMGHTRFTTQGDQRHNYNNHPFRGYAGSSFALAHNGVLYNDTSLRREHNLPDTSIETDSYIAVQLVESKQELSFDSLRFAAEAVRGSYTFTILDSTDTIYIIKGDSPMHLIYYPQYGLYVYASTAEIMKEALRHLPQLQSYHETVQIKDGEIVQISPDGAIKREAFTMTTAPCTAPIGMTGSRLQRSEAVKKTTILLNSAGTTGVTSRRRVICSRQGIPLTRLNACSPSRMRTDWIVFAGRCKHETKQQRREHL